MLRLKGLATARFRGRALRPRAAPRPPAMGGEKSGIPIGGACKQLYRSGGSGLAMGGGAASELPAILSQPEKNSCSLVERFGLKSLFEKSAICSIA